MIVVGLGRTHARCSTRFCGCWAPERSGANCPTSTRPTRPAIAVSRSGCGPARWSTSRACWPRSYKHEENSTHRCLLHGGKKGGFAVGPTKRGKGKKIIAVADDHSLPLAVSIESASPHESQLVEGVLGHSFLDTLPPRLIGDKAYDSDRLDRDLAERYGIEMIAPHRGERRTPTQDGRPLRRYRRRWRVERLFAWFHHFRRLVIRWEYHVENFFGMVCLGCMKILFRYL